jgi:hypothetical protein
LVFFVGNAISGVIEPPHTDEISDSRRASTTDVLRVSTTGDTDDLMPSAGKAIEVIGFNAIITQGAPTGSGGQVLCYSIDDAGAYIALFRYDPTTGVGNNSIHTLTMSDIVFKGGVDKGVGLSNMTWTGGTAVKVAVTLFYREV